VSAEPAAPAAEPPAQPGGGTGRPAVPGGAGGTGGAKGLPPARGRGGEGVAPGGLAHTAKSVASVSGHYPELGRQTTALRAATELPK
jgi:hypothetical protein